MQPQQQLKEPRSEPRDSGAAPASVVGKDESLLALLARNAKSHPAQPAIRERDQGIWQELSWAEELEEVLAFAAGLEEHDCGPDDRVLVIGDNRPRLYMGMLGAIALRAVPSPAYPDTTPQEVGAQAERERIRFAMAEDQEQVDKLLDARGESQWLKTIVYDDPRGMSNYDDPGVVSFQAVLDRGKQRLAETPKLRDDLLARGKADDPAVLLHSSGTTGAPKGIPLTHRNVIAGVRNAAEAGYFKEGEDHMAYLPMAWVGDFIFSIGAALILRFTINIPEKQETALHDLREVAPTLYFSSPRAWSGMLTRIQVGIDESTGFKRKLYNSFMPFAVELERRRLEGKEPNFGERIWRRIGEALVFGPIKDHLGLSRVERAYTAGEAIGDDVFLYFRALGMDLRQFYGQTENCALAAAQGLGDVKLHTVGRPFPGVEIKLSEDGEILMRGENVFTGYFEDPDSTAKTLENGWLHTGDAGYMEDDGDLVVLGRVSEVVYTAGGERYIPTYIENRLKFSQYIRDCCIIGQGRDYLTAIICIDIDAVGHYAEENGVAYTSYADLSQRPLVYDLVEEVIANVNRVLPETLQVKRFVNLHKPFDPDDGEVTRTRKVRRNVIDEYYGPIIEALYKGESEIEYEAQITYETGETGAIKRHLALRDVAAAKQE